MLQNIIVYIIIAGAVAYTVYAVVRSLTSKGKSSCEGCGGCEVKQEILKNIKGNKKEKLSCYH